MDRAFASGASGTPPTAPASPSIGYPTNGNAGTGTPATKPGEYWYHMITEEMRAVIAAAGLTPSQSNLTQLLQALPGALASRPEMARSLVANGYQKLPGGLIIQWGEIGVTTSITVTLPVAFPNAFLQAAVTPYLNSGEAPAPTTVLIGVEYTTKALSSFKINCNNAGARLISWIAIGR